MMCWYLDGGGGTEAGLCRGDVLRGCLWRLGFSSKNRHPEVSSVFLGSSTPNMPLIPSQKSSSLMLRTQRMSIWSPVWWRWWLYMWLLNLLMSCNIVYAIFSYELWLGHALVCCIRMYEGYSTMVLDIYFTIMEKYNFPTLERAKSWCM
jgi:hypothetical protein